jgi:hypothetical protein
MFAKLREEVKRLKPDEPGISIDMTEAEMLDALNSIERTLEYTEVLRNALAWCDQVEHEAATMPWPDVIRIGSIAGVAAFMIAISTAHAQTTGKDLSKLSGREYLLLCSVPENEHPCLQAVYTSATVNRMLDAIKNQTTFCPAATNAFPPTDIVPRVTAWLGSHPPLLDKSSDEALSAALVQMYPCR